MDLSHLSYNSAAIDFGISNTDVVVYVDGKVTAATQRTAGTPSPAQVEELLARCGAELHQLRLLATTGGRHRLLPAEMAGARVIPVGELEAIARGGQALAGVMHADQLDEALLVVSAGSGTAYMAARGTTYAHVIGSGVGGGTLLGMSRLLLGVSDPIEINRLALAGSANGVDLTLSDVVMGPIGTLPPDTTAVNFGRLAQAVDTASREDIAAGIVTLVGQVVGTLAVTAARGQSIERAVISGHLTDMSSMRQAIERVSRFFNFALELPENAGYATAIGALLYATEAMEVGGNGKE